MTSLPHPVESAWLDETHLLQRRMTVLRALSRCRAATTSMGRLTLNVLLSFAQFEREVTGERIRDKIAASKKKGLWMGGLPSLGYDVKDRKLIVNEAESNATSDQGDPAARGLAACSCRNRRTACQAVRDCRTTKNRL